MPKWLLESALIVGAGLLYAVALKYFVLPSQVILTGSEGIAAALSYYFESFWLFVILYVVFQAALLGFAFARVSRTFAARSMIVVATVVVMLAILPDFQFARPEPQHERIILVIFGGLLAGVAKAVAFKNRGSTGDEDIVAAYFAMKFLKPVGSVAVLAAVVSTGFGLLMDYLKNGQFESVVNTLMYTCIYIFASVETLNNLYHKFQITMVAIVTHQPAAVGAAIRQASPYRTYTVQQGVGGYSGKSFHLFQAIITREELPQLIEAISKADPECFHYWYDLDGISRRFYIEPIG